MLASNATSRQQAHSRMGRPTTGCAGRWHVVKDKDPSTCFVFVTSRGSGQAACGLPLDARSLQPVSGWDEGVQRALLVGYCLQYCSHAVLSFSWHERLLVWAAAMINNTRLSYRASIHIQPTYVSWEHGTQSPSAVTPDYHHPLGYHTRFTHTSPPSSSAPSGAG